MNQNTLDQFKAEYDKALFKMQAASGRKEAVYWCHRATELRQVMNNIDEYKYEYSGLM